MLGSGCAGGVDDAGVMAPAGSTAVPGAVTVAATRPPTTLPAPVIDVDAAWAWGAAYLGSRPGPARGVPVVLGVVQQAAPGPAEGPAVTAVAGAEAAVAAVNARFGGVRGRPLVLRRCMAGTADEARACASRLADDPAVAAVLTLGLRDGGAEVARVLRRRLPVLVAAPLRPGDLTAAEAFAFTGGVGVSVPLAGVVASTFLDPRPSTVLVLHDDDAGGREALDAFLAPVLDGADIAVDAVAVPPGATADDMAVALAGAGMSRHDTVALLLDPPRCDAAVAAMERFTGDRRVFVPAPCLGRRIADPGAADLPDGWYVTGDGFLPALPHAASGTDAFLAAARAVDGPVWGLAGPSFATVLVAARVLGDLAERTGVAAEDVDPAERIAAFAAFDGPVPLQAGDVRCRHDRRFPTACATAGGVQVTVDGRWASVADGLLGRAVVLPVPTT